MKYISLIALFFSVSCWADDPLEVRNPHNLANFVESEHFVFYWGEGIASNSLTPAFETLEYAWQVLIEQRGFKRPPTSEQYKFNVYISGTGQPVVDDFESALHGTDNEGHGYIVVNKNNLIKVNDLKLGLTHEFFHAIQYGYESHKLNPSPWLVESTAAWAPQEVFPEITLHLADQALGQYAFYPHYPLDYIGKEGVDEYLLQGHQYGTFIFFQHASLVLNDNDFVLKLHQFIEELTSNDNLSAISAFASFVREEYGVELADLYHSFVARNAVWDYPHQSEIQTALSQRSIGNNNYHIANELSALDRGWLESKNLEPLYRWGGQYIKLGPLAETNIELSFQGSATGDLQSEAKWQLSAVVDSNSGIEYIELPLVGNTIEAQAITVAEGATVWLAISVTSNGKSNKELYSYRYQLAKNGESQAIPSTPLVVEIPLINDAKSGGIFYGFCLVILIFGFMRRIKPVYR